MKIGIDLGGTKIEGAVLDGGAIVERLRVPTPQGDYQATVQAVADVVSTLEQQLGRQGLTVGIGHPGSISPSTGRLRNSNSVCLNDRPLQQDLEAALRRPLRLANDADCLALSEAADGAAAGAANVFAVILGTGVGGGIAINGQLLRGHNGIAGEWGHNALPRPRPEWAEVPGPRCWCGRYGCIETWLSGPALAADHRQLGGEPLSAEDIGAMTDDGDVTAGATLSRYEDRLARALAGVINVLDPDVIVLGGGVSKLQRLYRYVPALWDEWVFSDLISTRLVPALHGDSSGVRGAARLWPG